MIHTILTQEAIVAYRCHLTAEEKAPATISKYLRDVAAFYRFLPDDKKVSREAVLRYKQTLTQTHKAAGANSMLVALNSFLAVSFSSQSPPILPSLNGGNYK